MSTTAALIPGHYFMSSSGPDGRWARCQCGHDLPWGDRHTAHARHLMAVAWQEGAEVDADAVLRNPYVLDGDPS